MKLKLYIFSFAFVSSFYNSFAADTIEPNQTLLDNGQTLISVAEEFELGFFSPLNSKNHYIGIWSKKVRQRTVIWVANRDNPLSDSSGVFTISQTGNILIFSNKSGITYWSSNSSSNGAPILRLLDTGNLVVKDGDGDDNGNENYKWQSFEHPSDTLIAGMKQGWNLKTGQHWYLTSWKNPQDPSTGSYRYQIDPRGLPQLVQLKGSEVVYRTGPWDGVRFGGDPPLETENPIFKPIFVFNTTHVYYTFENKDHASFSRFWVNPSGSLQHLRWNENRKEWTTIFTLQKDECDTFGSCGPNGVCDINKNPVCHCPTGFVPKAPQDWIRLDTSGGCVPKTKLSCGMEVGFKKFSRMKLPYGTEFLVNRMVTKQDKCEAACLRNCSCMAYAMARISGCVLWFEDLLDMRAYNEFGQDLYIRMAASELESNNNGKRTVLIISLSASSMFFILVVMVGGYIIRKRTYNNKSQDERIVNPDEAEDHCQMDEDIELPSFNLATISIATSNFSSTNILGEGGFGIVYKGVLPNGQEIAVKRLSKDSRQGPKEFKNEVVLISKLQHRNLVRLLGCCILREDRMLIYEYMPKKSLDLYIFDQTKGTALDWHRRFNIIVGIARGLLYLHRDSRLRIIHRDLKTSNILLDNEMNPKISDFGLARVFGGDMSEINTKRVMGTYGYMSPEYAIDGLFSMKSDVFSFGVMVLEIVSGKKNRGFSHPDHDLNLLGHAWKLWNEDRAMDLMDNLMEKNPASSEGLRCIQIGLLCVQKCPEDRPLMSSVLMMLDGENASLPQPKQPGFYTERVLSESTFGSTWSMSNEVTVTTFHGR